MQAMAKLRNLGHQEHFCWVTQVLQALEQTPTTTAVGFTPTQILLHDTSSNLDNIVGLTPHLARQEMQ
jgi:hypothetical protein